MGLIVVEQLQTYLVDQGVGQLPGADASTATPAIYTMPRQGAAMPRTSNGDWLEHQTVTLDDTQLAGPPGLASWLKDTFIDVVVRSRNASEGKLLIRTIEGLIHPIGAPAAGKRDWTMNELHVLYSNLWRGEKPLPAVDNALTYDRVVSFRFTCARSDLA